MGDSVIWFILVAAIWGCTNPFLKQGGKGIERVKASNKFYQIVLELKFLILNWRYILPFLINQSGSVLYFMTLSSADLSVAVPVTNSLTFIFTAIVGLCLGEKISAGLLVREAGVPGENHRAMTSTCQLSNIVTLNSGTVRVRVVENMCDIDVQYASACGITVSHAGNGESFLGMVLVLCGVTLCVVSKPG